ncbi:MAG: Flp family type IVb pilin [Burkholderiales bacterium]
MEKFISATRRFIRDEEGVTAIEYGLIAALISLLIIGGVTSIGESLCNTFSSISVGLGGPLANCPAPPA